MDDVREQVKANYLSGMMPKELSKKYDISLNTIKSWIKRGGWSKIKNTEGAPSITGGAPSDTLQKASPKRKHGGQPGNKNAIGHGAPEKNKNAEKYGFFSKYLPAETISIIQEMPEDPLDILWDQIQISYAAIIRAQQIMYVRDRDDMSTTKIEERSRDSSWGKKWEVQQAWDKQANFLQAQSRAQKTLESMVKQYDDLLHKNWEMASEEQKVRIEQMRANADRLKRDSNLEEDEGVEIINDAPEEAGADIRTCDTEIPSDIQQ